ncbi:hypothetical protein LCGC14_2596700 [marine sediment metagenome]|uniref:DUF3083 family protein n=1 Tax=marine sediment metagenome TaxID=412755 RepID=A0A0F9CL03_9ZZZZ|nr:MULTISPECIES: DUF3083 family protein [unclassified Pseudoalteromonas]HDY93729.1 DUF3083 family protein [Pseudoalteromonas sp.]
MATLNQHRVYIPTNARANHYLLAEITPNHDFYKSFSDINCCYERIARQLFASCDEYELYNVHLLANDKLPVVRFNDESYQLETDKQMLFFYNPRYHEAHKIYYTEGTPSKKIRILFLATGDDLRANSAEFHNKVQKVLDTLQEQLLINQPQFKLRDHQHLTYDLFAKEKGNKESYGYKLRSLYPRYQSRQCSIPNDYAEMTYATFTIPVSRAIKTQFQTLMNTNDYAKFYDYFAYAFIRACQNNNLNHGAMVANGATPIIRNSKIDKSEGNDELQKLSFDIESNENQIKHFYEANKLVETLHFVVVATQQDKHEMGYGRFMNQVEKTIYTLCNELAINKQRQDLSVRFFQHISYPF